MKMYLPSFRLGDHPERLIALLTDASGPAAIIRFPGAAQNDSIANLRKDPRSRWHAAGQTDGLRSNRHAGRPIRADFARSRLGSSPSGVVGTKHEP
jgi:hypothetical protein